MKQLKARLKSAFNIKYIIALNIFIITGFCTYAQTADSLHKPAKELKNTIKYNATMSILYDKAFQLGYERVINKHQTMNIVVGYQEFPVSLNLLNLDSTKLSPSKKKSGYSFGVDYRFYLSKENKYNAPRGVYVAPFISVYHFLTDRTLTHTDTSGVQSSTNLNTKIDFINVGAELGYQFVLGKRFVIDAVVFGPAFTHYNFKAKLENALPNLDEHETLQAVIDALKEKLPFLNNVSSDEGVNKSGTEAFWSLGFRYNISIGFRF